MRVYRVQDKRGRGPFAPGMTRTWYEPSAKREMLPAFFMEFPDLRLPRGDNNGCGCTSIEQLRKWFTESEYRKLEKMGYHAVELHAVEILAQSENQCVFTCAKPLRKNAMRVALY